MLIAADRHVREVYLQLMRSHTKIEGITVWRNIRLGQWN